MLISLLTVVLIHLRFSVIKSREISWLNNDDSYKLQKYAYIARTRTSEPELLLRTRFDTKCHIEEPSDLTPSE